MTEDDLPDLDNLDDIDLDDLPEAADEGAEWWDFDDASEMADAVAGDVAFIIESALDARGQALIALPVKPDVMPLLKALADKDIKWKYVTVIPTDDLLVAVDNERSHVRALAQLFMTKGARVLPIATENPDYRLAGKAADARLQDLHWPPDLVWLTMGDMGGTAGIYEGPDKAAALDAGKGVRAIGLMPQDYDQPRVTLTRGAIAEARTLIVTLKGSDAQMGLEQALADGAQSPAPIGRVLDGLTMSVDIYVENG